MTGLQEDTARRVAERREKIAAMQAFVDAGLRSGIGTRSREELFRAARASLASAEPRDRCWLAEQGNRNWNSAAALGLPLLPSGEKVARSAG